jgi:hypothetical protein
MFRPVQGHHQGDIYRVIQIQQILSDAHVSLHDAHVSLHDVHVSLHNVLPIKITYVQNENQ